MRPTIPTFQLLAFIGCTAASGTLKIPLSKRDASGQQSHVARGVILKRQDSDGTVEQSVFDVLPWSLGGAYYTNISVGTPPQVQTVILDTGSSDTYFDAREASSCEESETNPYSCRGGTFDSSSSSTYRVQVANGFDTAFGDGSTASGDFATDVVQVGDVAIQNVQFGVASDINTTTGFSIGLMGIGYSENEASNIQYANIPEVLRDAGVINSRLYSIFLNDIDDASGTILFGGIDTSKYTAPLTTLDLIPVPISTSSGDTVDLIYEFVVAVTGLVSIASGTNKTYFSGGAADGSSGSLPVLLDTGSAAWTAPTSVYNSIAELLPEMDQYGYLPCSAQSKDISLVLTFGGKADISVPISELVVPVYDAITNEPNTTSNGEALCTFMISPGEATQDQPFLTLGDAVLRSMYVVFDLDNGQVSIAQAHTNTSTSATTSGSGDNIKVVQAGSDGVASAVGSGGVRVASSSAAASIAGAVSVTESFIFKTTSPAVGTATGTDAVPTDGRVDATSASATGSGSGATGSGSGGTGSGSAATSSGVASGLVVPTMRTDFIFSGMAVVLGMVAGAALMM